VDESDWATWVRCVQKDDANQLVERQNQWVTQTRCWRNWNRLSFPGRSQKKETTTLRLRSYSSCWQFMYTMFYVVSSPEINVDEDVWDDGQMMSNSGQERPLQSVFNVQETDRHTHTERERERSMVSVSTEPATSDHQSRGRKDQCKARRSDRTMPNLCCLGRFCDRDTVCKWFRLRLTYLL